MALCTFDRVQRHFLVEWLRISQTSTVCGNLVIKENRRIQDQGAIRVDGDQPGELS